MKRFYVLAASLLIVVLMLAGAGRTGAQRVSSLKLTVYDNFALIEERRVLSLSGGERWYTVENLPRTIDSSSVIFRPLEPGVRLLEQELLLLQRQAPEPIPVLSWKIQSEYEGDVQSVLSYLAGGLSWAAYYTIILNESEDRLGLTSWVRLENHSGRDYPDATLTLVAGELRRVTGSQTLVLQETSMTSGVFHDVKAEPFVVRPTFEYHEYNLARPATVNSGQTLQLSFLSAEAIRASKHYVYEPADDEHRVRVELRNQKDSDIVIEVQEKLPGEWKIISAKPAYEKLDANTVLFEVSVPAGGTAIVKYTVEWK